MKSTPMEKLAHCVGFGLKLTEKQKPPGDFKPQRKKKKKCAAQGAKV